MYGSAEMPMLEMDSSVGSVGSRKRAGKHYTVEDEALDRIAKEVGLGLVKNSRWFPEHSTFSTQCFLY